MNIKYTKPAVCLCTLPYRAPEIREGKLGRKKVLGLADNTNQTITLEERLDHDSRLSVLVHELLHIAFPYMAEAEVERAEQVIAPSLIKEGYKRGEGEN
jgi:hypothetical protein